MPSLLSVNVGMPRISPGKAGQSTPACGNIRSTACRVVRRLNVDGDGQGDLAGHGGEHRAVFVYQMDFIVIGSASSIETTSPMGSSVRISPSTACLTKRCALAIATE